jgi:thioredoxin-like negative regulator of GroEL
MKEIAGQDFDKEVLDCKLPVFACFTARWCHTCYPTCLFADQLVETYGGRVKFVRVDIEKSSGIAERYHIIPIPTILLLQDSQPVKKLVGFQDLSSLKAMLNSVIGENEATEALVPEGDGGL